MALRGTLTVPGDKSITHRAIILSALADGDSTITGYCAGEDCLNTARVLQAMGVPMDITPEHIKVSGKGLWGLQEPGSILDCGNSGTGIRLLAGVLVGQDFFCVLTGDDSIRRRPMGRVVSPLREMGALIAGRRGGELAPLAITGTRRGALRCASPFAGGQGKSSGLRAGLFSKGTMRGTEPALSRDHTERLFDYLGIPLTRHGLTVSFAGQGSFAAKDIRVVGDLSAAAFFIVGATLVSDSDVLLMDVGVNPTRTGILDILKDMGAQIDLVNSRVLAGEPVADIRVRSAQLRGTTIGADRIPRTIDELPILCVAAACAQGDTVISGARELRVKESDRIATMATELRRLGVEVEERVDGMRIRGGRPLTGAVCQSHGDHRVAMSMAIAGLLTKGETRVEDTACVATSFPDFDKKLRGLLTPSGQG